MTGLAPTSDHHAAAGSATGEAPWLTGKRFAAILGVLIFLAFPHVVLGVHSFIYRDFGLFGYPLAHYHREALWRGEIPLWNPYNNFGIPFLAEWGTMVLYPPSLIYVLLPLPWSLSLFCLLHLFFGGLGMYVLMRRWTDSRIGSALAGIGFAFNGFAINCLMWPNYTASLAWMPWVALLVWRAWREGGKWIVYAGLAGALQMLSGTPEVILFTWLLMGALCGADAWGSWDEAKRFGRRFGLAVALVTALSAAQLLPFFELLSHSTRSSDFAKGQWPLPAWGWANLFVPLFRTYRAGSGVHFQDGQGVTTSYYPGLLVIVLAVVALCWRRDRRVWLLWALVVISFVLAMGEHTPVYGWLREMLPAIGFMRYPSKFVMIPIFVWPVLAAFGWAALTQKREMRGFGIATAAVATVVLGILAFGRLMPFPDEHFGLTVRNGLERLALLGVACGLVYWVCRSARARLIGVAAVLLVAWFDLLKHVPLQNPTVVTQALTTEAPHLAHMQPRPRLGESRALLTLSAMQKFHLPGTSNLVHTYLAHRGGLYDNCNLLEAIPKADGFYALYIREERDIHYRLYETDDQPRANLARFTGISYVSGKTNVLEWEKQPDFMPLVTGGQTPVFADRERTLEGLIATDFNPRGVVYLPSEARAEIKVEKTNGVRILTTRVSQHRIEAEVEAAAPSIVVVAQTHYPRWRAYIDGKPAKIWRANHAFQALYVETGRHQLVWVYRDTPFWAGALISGMALGGCALLIGRSRMCTTRALIRDKRTPAGDGVTSETGGFTEETVKND